MFTQAFRSPSRFNASLRAAAAASLLAGSRRARLVHAGPDPAQAAPPAAAGDRGGRRRARRDRVGRVHRPARAGAVGRRPPACLGPDLQRCRSRKAAWSGRDRCSSRSTTGRSRRRSTRLRAELAQASAARDRAASEMRRADRLSTENAMSLEERERRAGAAAEAAAHVDAVAAALRAAELDLEFTRVVSPIDGRVSRALVTRGNLVSGGQGEATLLTTVVSRRSDLRLVRRRRADVPALRRPRPRSRARRRGASELPIQMALADEQTFPTRGHAAVSRQPARSVDRHDQRPRRSSATPIAA